MSEEATNTKESAPDIEPNENVEFVREFLSNPPDWLPDSLIQFVDNYNHPGLLSLIILLVGLMSAVILRYVCVKSLNRLSNKNVENQTSGVNNIELVAQLGKMFFTVIVSLTVVLAITSSLFPDAMKVTINRIVLSMLLIYFIVRSFKLATKIFIFLKDRRVTRFIQNKTVPLFSIIFQLFILALGSYFLIIIWGYDPRVWLASAGIIGIAIGFAAKDTLANLFAGVFIIADTQYQLGDYIVLSSQEKERGKVTHIGLRSTRILNRDDIELTIPNSIMGNAIVANESGGSCLKSRIRLPVGVAYGTELNQAIVILIQVCSDVSEVCTNPTPRVRVRAYGASSVDMELLCWIEHPEYRGLVKHRLYMSIYEQFNQQGIEIPYSKQDLYIKELPARNEGQDAPN